MTTQKHISPSCPWRSISHRCIAGFLASAIALGGCASPHRAEPSQGERSIAGRAGEGSGAQRSDQPSNEELYEQAIRAAAVRSLDWDKPLVSPGGRATVALATLTDYPESGAEKQYVWVSLPAELSSRCKGKPEPALALQQILGLPPGDPPHPGHRWYVVVFDVDARAVFRPCPGGLSPYARSCPAGNALDRRLALENMDKETPAEAKANNELARFLLAQLWAAHHVTFVTKDGPEPGYPWTGMGWTYDWSPDSKDHVGVSEYVVKKGATVIRSKAVSPEKFCSDAYSPK